MSVADHDDDLPDVEAVEIEAVDVAAVEIEAEAEVDELVVEFDGEEPAKPEHGADSNLVRDLRKRLREQSGELARERASKTAAAVEIEAGPRPTLEASDWDEDAHTEAVEAWLGRKRAVDTATATRATEATAVQAEWESELATHRGRAAKLGARDYADAEAEAVSKLDVVQQRAIVSVAKDSAAVLYALGKTPSRLEALAKIKNPFKFTAAIIELERSMKVVRNAPPSPERIAKGGASFAGTSHDKALAALEKESERTGNRNAVKAYRRSHNLSA